MVHASACSGMARPGVREQPTMSLTSGLLTSTGCEAASEAAAEAALPAAQESMSASAVHSHDAPISGAHEGGVVSHFMGVPHRLNIGLLLDHMHAKYQLDWRRTIF